MCREYYYYSLLFLFPIEELLSCLSEFQMLPVCMRHVWKNWTQKHLLHCELCESHLWLRSCFPAELCASACGKTWWSPGKNLKCVSKVFLFTLIKRIIINIALIWKKSLCNILFQLISCLNRWDLMYRNWMGSLNQRISPVYQVLQLQGINAF